MNVDYSMVGNLSIGYRTADSFDGLIDGVHYVVYVDRWTDTVKRECRVLPPEDSVKFKSLSKAEQREDEISRRVPLDKNELNRISNAVEILNRLDAEYLSVDKYGNIYLKMSRKNESYAFIMAKSFNYMNPVLKKSVLEEKYERYQDNWFICKRNITASGRILSAGETR